MVRHRRLLSAFVGIAALLVLLCPKGATGKVRQESGSVPAATRMPDGKQWTTENLRAVVAGSFCYDDAEANCRKYGRLYTWESAMQACQSLGDGWRLPTNEDWQQMAKHYGGLWDDSSDNGKATFKALMTGGSAHFDALFGGNRDADGKYARLEAHGLYWSASETDRPSAWMFNFGKGGQGLSRHRNGNKLLAVSVRCVKN